MESLRARPPRQVLPADRLGAPPARRRNARVGAHVARHRPRDEARMILRDWQLRARALFRPNHVERELQEELDFHIEREAMKLIDDGLAPDEARRRAQARFGSTALAADQCRDERGTAIIDNTIRDVQYALRTFAKNPLSSFTIVATVALGLGVVAMVFSVFNTMVFRVDNVPDISEMYEVVRPGDNGGQLTIPVFEAMREETSVFT